MIKHKKLIGSILAISSLGVGATVLATNIFSKPTEISAKDTLKEHPTGVISTEEAEKLSVFPENFEEFLANWEKDNPELDKNVVGIESLRNIYEEHKQYRDTDHYLGKNIDQINSLEEYIKEWELMNPELDKETIGVDTFKDLYEEDKATSLAAKNLDRAVDYVTFEDFLADWYILNPDLPKDYFPVDTLKDFYANRKNEFKLEQEL